MANDKIDIAELEKWVQRLENMGNDETISTSKNGTLGKAARAYIDLVNGKVSTNRKRALEDFESSIEKGRNYHVDCHIHETTAIEIIEALSQPNIPTPPTGEKK